MNEGLEQYIQEKDGKIEINWKDIIALGNEHGTLRGNTGNARTYDAVLRMLEEKGILTRFNSRGSYSLTDSVGGVHINPHSPETAAFYSFSKKRDAQNYADALILYNSQYGFSRLPLKITKVLEDKV
ncbi:hypothetical protein J4221_05845 [Candidatus Pacearchaeota archaeon]|nr:hypothetical protein [Candidatus Pacearchaeota archaeon]